MTSKIITARYLLKNKKPTFQCFYWNTYTDFRGVIPGSQQGKWRNNLKIMPRSVYSLARLAGWRVWVVLHNSQWKNLNTGIFGKTWSSYATAVWKKLTYFSSLFRMGLLLWNVVWFHHDTIYVSKKKKMSILIVSVIQNVKHQWKCS